MLKTLKSFLEKHSRVALVVFWVVNVGNILVSLGIVAVSIFIDMGHVAAIAYPTVFSIGLFPFFTISKNVVGGDVIFLILTAWLFVFTLIMLVFYYGKRCLFPTIFFRRWTKRLMVLSLSTVLLPLVFSVYVHMKLEGNLDMFFNLLFFPLFHF